MSSDKHAPTIYVAGASKLATFRCKTHEEAVELLKRAAGAAP
jgi:hypothetical protein